MTRGTDSRGTDVDGVVNEAFEQAPTVLVAYAAPDFRVAAANAAMRALLGDRGPLIGLPMREVLPELDGQQIFEIVERVYVTGVPETAHEWRVQLDRDRDGVAEDHYLNFTITPWHSPDGVTRGVLSHAVDVTGLVRERTAAQERERLAQKRYRSARGAAQELQAALLPAMLPILPGVRIEAQYVLADDDATAGGDWFDAVPLADGRLGLVVGDVVGHGVAAAAVMGQLRTVLAERLSSGAEVVEALTAADRFAERIPDARATTVAVAVVDPSDGVVHYCTAGHPPPLVVGPAGGARFLPVSGAGPLGVGRPFTGAQVREERLAVDEVLLLYTDGLVERPGRDLAESTVELARVAGDAAAGRIPGSGGLSAVERVCAQTLELLLRATGHADDVTLLAVQRIAGDAELELAVPADPSAPRSVRSALHDWLDGLGVGGDGWLAVQHAVGELVTNAVEHAYLDSIAPEDAVTVRGDLTTSGRVRLAVADRGRWRDRLDNHGSPGRGLGLAIARELADDVRLDRGPEGTTITLEMRVGTSPRLFAASDIGVGTPWSTPPLDEPPLLIVLDQPTRTGERIRVDGPVDSATAPQLYGELRRRTRGGTRPLTVDFTGVTLLSSAAVAVLHEFARDAVLRIFAPPGSPAAHVLTLVALDHDEVDPDDGAF